MVTVVLDDVAERALVVGDDEPPELVLLGLLRVELDDLASHIAQCHSLDEGVDELAAVLVVADNDVVEVEMVVIVDELV